MPNPAAPLATHEVTACYFPGKGDAEITFRNYDTNEEVFLKFKVSKKVGMKLAEVICPCLYWQAKVVPPCQGEGPKRKQNVITKFPDML